MKNRVWKVILLVLCVSIPSVAFAETVILKSGQKVDGKIIEKTDKYITIDFEGVVLTYFLDEIASIDESKKPDLVISEDNPNKQEVQIEESDIPTVTLKEGSAGIQQINAVYYNLTRYGLQQFKCEITGSSFDSLKLMLKEEYPSAGSENKILDDLRFYLTYDNVDDEGKENFYIVASTQTGDAKIDDAINEAITYTRNILKGFFPVWTQYLVAANPIEPDFNYIIEKVPSGYSLLYEKIGTERSTKIQLDSKLRIIERVDNSSEGSSKISPHFINSKHGFLLQSFEGDSDNGSMKKSATMSYEEIDGLQMLKQLTIKTIFSGKEGNLEINFSDYKIKKMP
ncbi:MAG: hypothetical protein PHT50_02645 [Candidatus Omnitrophica bacterium]|nr:hypothetical protein [Candidatus Omnitrophota bacterium]